ncbi:MAG TPA: hypothetical protein PLC54_03370, partial [Spirochaetales bacterium]|nr:hypothetical protein [Spirochaetales bacterium]
MTLDSPSLPRRLLPLVFLCACAAGVYAQGTGSQLFPPSGSYASALNLEPVAGGELCSYCFSETSAWIALDRPLVLDAFPGEERYYRIRVLDAFGRETLFEYRIDKRPPPAPVLLPAQAQQTGTLIIQVKASDAVMLSVDGSPFAPYDGRMPPEFRANPSGLRDVHAVAYSIDASGNKSPLVRASWSLVPQGFTPSFPYVSPEVPRAPSSSAASPVSLSARQEASVGLIVDYTVPAGTTPVLAVWADGPQPGPESYAELGCDSFGRGSVVVPLPFGYAQKISVSLGYRSGDTLVTALASTAVLPLFSSQPKELQADTAPQPRQTSIPGSTTISWPQSSYSVFIDDGNGIFTPYTQPVIVRYEEPKEIRWFAVDASKRRTKLYRLSVRPQAPQTGPLV